MAVMSYRTEDGFADYGFSIEYQQDAGWRVYIVFEPPYQNHNNNLRAPYQSIDHEERRYIDWSSRLDSLGDAKTIATLWAEIAHRCRVAYKQKINNDQGIDTQVHKLLKGDAA